MFEPNYEYVKTKINTPAYVFDTDVLRERIQLVRNIFGDKVRLCYAMKANPFVIKEIEKNIDCYEVCSQGEFEICERANIAINKVVLSGVYKAENDLRRLISQYIDQILYTSESIHQFDCMNKIARECGCKVKTLLRITTGNQFGMSEDDLCSLVKRREQFSNIEIVGIQHFSRTQRKSLNIYKKELEYVDCLITKLKQEYGYRAKELEFGPGFYVEYFHGSKHFDEIQLLEEFNNLLNNIHFDGHITLELGRFIAASCGHYYTTIVDYKENSIPYCIVNGGMHQMLYFGQMMGMKLPFYRQLKKEIILENRVECNISGSLCTTNDNLVKALPLFNPQIGDIIEFQRVGAYSMCEGMSLFLSRDIPSIYLYSKQDGLCLQRGRFETNILNYKQ